MDDNQDYDDVEHGDSEQLNDNMVEDVNDVAEPSHLSRLQQFTNMLEFQRHQLMHAYAAFHSNTPMRRIMYRQTTYTGADWINELLSGHDLRFYDAMGHQRHRRAAESFNRSTETISNHVHIMVTALCKLAPKIASAPSTEPSYQLGYLKKIMKNTDVAKVSSPGVDSVKTNPQNARELFNRRHATVRNVVERSFGILKGKFPIIKGLMPNYPPEFQTDIVIACCVAHNFILEHQKFANIPPAMQDPDYIPEPDEDDFTRPLRTTSDTSNVGLRKQSGLHDSIADALWRDHGGRHR
ncbi:Unknown protein [Striga hermonthica]|uniref:DDE Tnp4 domain-containing protein n=1 Tax=Striga hermonthica TaxID=68872 RepID=A0A9N7NWQ7_STRHE|nr:Unknown protein [Striga hermonthica]